MKKLIFIVALLIISCSNQESFEFAEGKILNIEKGAKTGSFEFIDVIVKNKEVRFYSNNKNYGHYTYCLLYTSPSPRDRLLSRMPSSA